jgi:hypothetical protein
MRLRSTVPSASVTAHVRVASSKRASATSLP